MAATGCRPEALDSAWTALVLVSPFPGVMLVDWVNADRLKPIHDPSPADGS
jgi:hypothetical protein